jgi:hypothetical protein
MPPKANKASVEKLWKHFACGIGDKAKGLFHKDFVALWPQSHTKIENAGDFLKIQRNYIQTTVLRTLIAGNNVIAEVATVPLNGMPCFIVGIYEFSGGKIIKAVEYFADIDEPAN